MNSMSLARIMYGTNEDQHATTSMSRNPVPSRALATTDNRSEAASTGGALAGLLQIIWSKLKS
jgi:hypothetical protein